MVMTVDFENDKIRGDCVESMTFQFDKRADTGYMEKLASVKRVDDTGKLRLQALSRKSAFMEKNNGLVKTIVTLLSQGPANQSDITQFVKQENGGNKNVVADALRLFKGLNAADKEFWTESKGAKNASIYKLNPCVMI